MADDFFDDFYKSWAEERTDYYEGVAGVPPVCAGWNKGILGAGKGKGVKPVVYKGVWYESRTAAAEANGVEGSGISAYAKRDPKIRGRYERPVVYKGRRYNNLRECVRITGNPYSSVAVWVRRHPEVQPEYGA